MFDTNDQSYIQRIIDTKTKSQLIIPLYIKIYNNTYSLLEMDDITDFNPSSFKLGFGTKTSIFDYNPFIQKHIIEFENRNIFSIYNDNSQSYTQYYTFESDYVDESISDMHKQINEFIDLIMPHVSDIVKTKKQEMIRKLIEENSV